MRVETKKANKDYPEFGIKKGDTYYQWCFYRQRPTKSKTYPTRSQLTHTAGRCCWVCGKVGGHGFTNALRWAGYRMKHGDMAHAHPRCMAVASRQHTEYLQQLSKHGRNPT